MDQRTRVCDRTRRKILPSVNKEWKKILENSVKKPEPTNFPTPYTPGFCLTRPFNSAQFYLGQIFHSLFRIRPSKPCARQLSKLLRLSSFGAVNSFPEGSFRLLHLAGRNSGEIESCAWPVHQSLSHRGHCNAITV
jgi:hypothetical protein